MTERPDMRYWPFEEFTQGEQALRRIINGDLHGVWWAVMGASGSIPGYNGYAQIPWEGHPWSGCRDYNELEVECHGGLTYGPSPEFDMQASMEDLADQTRDTDMAIPIRVPDPPIPVHPAKEFTDVGGWIGFDTHHAWDWWPDEELARHGLVRTHPEFTYRLQDEHEIVWTVEKIIAEAQDLATQIAAHGIATKANRKREVPRGHPRRARPRG